MENLIRGQFRNLKVRWIVDDEPDGPMERVFALPDETRQNKVSAAFPTSEIFPIEFFQFDGFEFGRQRLN